MQKIAIATFISIFTSIVGVAIYGVSTPAAASAEHAIPTRAVGASAQDYPRGEACASRIAIDVTFGSVCTDHCVTEAHCPEGWMCKPIEQGNGQEIGLCFPRRIQAPAPPLELPPPELAPPPPRIVPEEFPPAAEPQDLIR